MVDKRYSLGVDIGGTKSHCLVANNLGEIIGFGQSGPGNWADVGWDGLREALQVCVMAALDEAGLHPGQIAGAGFGIAEYDWPEDYEPISRIIESLGLDAPYNLVNDAIIALVAGTETGWGVVVVAGTGTNCRGRNQDGREGRVTGMGSDYGEHGGATEIVERAIRAVALAWTKRGPSTKLTDLFLSLTKATDQEDLLAGLSRGRYSIGPDASRLVFQASRDGDAVARDIIRWAGTELGDLALGVIRQLDLAQEKFDVVLAGSTFDGGQTLIKQLERHIHQEASGARMVRLAAPPVVGGVLLAMEQANLNPAPLRSFLVENAIGKLENR